MSDDLRTINPVDIEARAQEVYQRWWKNLCDMLKLCLTTTDAPQSNVLSAGMNSINASAKDAGDGSTSARMD